MGRPAPRILYFTAALAALLPLAGGLPRAPRLLPLPLLLAAMARGGPPGAFAAGALFALLLAPGPRPLPARVAPAAGLPAGPVRLAGRLGPAQAPDRFGRVEAEIAVRGGRLPLSLRVLPGHEPPGAGDLVRGLAWLERGPAGAQLRTSAAVLTTAPRLAPLPGRAELRTGLARLFARWVPEARARAFALRLAYGAAGRPTAEVLAEHRSLGLAHLLAVSGLHAVLAAGFLSLALAWLPGRGRRFAAVTILLAVWAWLTGGRPPVVRALLAWTIWRGARFLGRRPAPGALLAAAAASSLVLDPAVHGWSSLLLSHLAVAGLIWLRPLLAGPLSHLPRPLRAAAAPFVTSLAAWLPLTGPLWLLHGRLSPWGVVLSPLALPLVFAVLALALLLPAAAAAGGLAAARTGDLLSLLAGLHVEAVHWLARHLPPPWTAAGPPPPAPAWTLLAALHLLAVLGRSPRLFLGASLVGLSLGLWPAAAPRRTELRVLAVGHGQCVLVRLGRRSFVFDCGDRLGGTRAARRLLAALSETGGRRIELCVLSHADQDHTGGLMRVAARVPVDLLVLPGGAEERRLARRLAPLVGRVAFVAPGRSLAPWPEVELSSAPLQDPGGTNDGGLVARLRLPAGPEVWLFGDQGEAALAALLPRLPPTTERPRILLLPHHGERGLLQAALIERLAPAVLLVSNSAAEEQAAAPGPPRLATGRAGTLRLVRTEAGYRFFAEAGLPAASFSPAARFFSSSWRRR